MEHIIYFVYKPDSKYKTAHLLVLSIKFFLHFIIKASCAHSKTRMI